MFKRLGIFFTVFVCFCVIWVCKLYAFEEKVLKERTQLRPLSWPQDKTLWFAPGVYTVDPKDGGVESGILDQEAELEVWKSHLKYRFGKGYIKFDQTGRVMIGELAKNTEICVVNTSSSKKKYLLFMGKKTVVFGYDGCVVRGTLAKQATLKTWDMKEVTYSKGTTVSFTTTGLVKVATPP
jgi:hypothetical protein